MKKSQKFAKTVENDQKRSKMIKNGQKCQKQSIMGPWSKFSQKDKNESEWVENAQEVLKRIGKRAKLPKICRKCVIT